MTGRKLKKKIRETIVAILTKYDAERIAIFGSYARGEAVAKSDIDILVRFSRPKSLFQLVRIEDEIEETLHMTNGHTNNGIWHNRKSWNPAISPRSLRRNKRSWASEDTFCNFERGCGILPCRG